MSQLDLTSRPAANPQLDLGPLEDRLSALDRLEQSLAQLESLEKEIGRERTGDDGDKLDFAIPPGFLLSVIVPVYNEEATIGEVLSRLTRCPLPQEIVVVDDASTDGTRSVLELWQSAPGIRLIFKQQNGGKGAAIRTGLSEARGGVILVQDADLEYDPRDIPALVRPIVMGEADVVYGSRFAGYDRFAGAWWQALANRTLTFLSNRTTGVRLTDMETGYKAFTREAIHGIQLTQDRLGLEPEVTAKLARRGSRFVETPIRYAPRTFAEGKKIRLKDAFYALYAIARFGWGD